mgnify:CR=1 FL=1
MKRLLKLKVLRMAWAFFRDNIKVILFYLFASAMMASIPFVISYWDINPAFAFLSSVISGFFLIMLHIGKETLVKKILSIILCCWIMGFGYYLMARNVAFNISWNFRRYPEFSHYASEGLEAYEREAWKGMIREWYIDRGIPECFVYVDMAGILVGMLLILAGIFTSLKVMLKIGTVEGIGIVTLDFLIGIPTFFAGLMLSFKFCMCGGVNILCLLSILLLPLTILGISIILGAKINIKNNEF